MSSIEEFATNAILSRNTCRRIRNVAKIIQTTTKCSQIRGTSYSRGANLTINRNHTLLRKNMFASGLRPSTNQALTMHKPCIFHRYSFQDFMYFADSQGTRAGGIYLSQHLHSPKISS